MKYSFQRNVFLKTGYVQNIFPEAVFWKRASLNLLWEFKKVLFQKTPQKIFKGRRDLWLLIYQSFMWNCEYTMVCLVRVLPLQKHWPVINQPWSNVSFGLFEEELLVTRWTARQFCPKGRLKKYQGVPMGHTAHLSSSYNKQTWEKLFLIKYFQRQDLH